MALSILDFWKLVIESRLLTPAECKKLSDAYLKGKPGANKGDAAGLVEWLVSHRVISRYQAKLLSAGRAGPFVYGNYKVYDKIGSGRFAGLFKAVHAPTGHPVCLYFLSKQAAHPQAWAASVAQINAARHADHPHLSRCYELVDVGTYKFAVIEDVSGDAFDARVANGRIAPADACRIVRQAVFGLAQWHDLGQVHGDIRPANLWEAQHRARLLQIPLSRDPGIPLGPVNFAAAAHDPRLQVSADYMAPELVHHGREPDALTDIYAVGCTMYHLLTGRPPFAGGDIGHKMHRHANEPIQPLEPFGVPPQLGQVIAYMMAKDPSLRYRQASMVAEALGYFVQPGSEQPVSLPQTQAAYDNWLSENSPRQALPPANQPAAQPMASAAYGHAQPAAFSQASFGQMQPAHQQSAFAGIDEAPAPAPRVSKGARPIRRGQRNLYIMVGIGSVLLMVAVGAVLYAMNSGMLEEPEVPPIEGPIASANGEPAGEDTADGGAEEVPVVPVADDGSMLWASPTAGPPVTLQYMPQGTQLLLSIRPAEILEHPDGPKVLAAMGPQFQTLQNTLQTAAGMPLDSMERLVVAVYEREAGGLGTVLTVYRKVQSPIQQSPEYTYYLPPAENGRVVVIGSAADVKAVTDLKNGPGNMGQQAERLLTFTDEQRHFTMVFTPRFLFTDGAALWAGALVGLRGAAESFFGEDIQAAGLSFHLADSLFAELRLYGTLDTEPQARAKAFQARIEKLPDGVQRAMASPPPSSYASLFLISKYPDSLKYLARQTRSGMEGDHSVLRAYLPSGAGEYLALGTELAFSQRGGVQVAAVPPTAEPKKPATVAEALKTPTSLTFDRDTLEISMKTLSQDIGVPIEILGGDLQLDGITKNQSFKLDERDKPAGEILRTIMKLANPDGKLVYVIKAKEPGGPEMIFITTRAAVAKRRDKLPPELEKP